MTIEITGVLFNAQIYKCNIIIHESILKNHVSLPVQSFSHGSLKCKRCNKSEFTFCRDGDSYICFCLDSKCLKEDKEASKSKARQDKEKLVERNGMGIAMTGAEKFAVGMRYRTASVSSWVADQKHILSVYEWKSNEKPFLIITGRPGTGKTYAAAGILNYLFEKKFEVFFTTHRRFIQTLQEGIQDGNNQYFSIDKFSYKDFLIFDDLGSSTCSEWQKEMILELIDRRYSNKKKTLITTNFTKEEFSRFLGERTSSRILSSINEIIELPNEDRRENLEYEANNNSFT